MEIGIYQAKTHLAGLIQKVNQGEEVVITKRGRPVANLTKANPTDNSSLSDAISLIIKTRQARKQVTATQLSTWKNQGRA